jgi:DNA polymerase III alpha subunit (gram-positive type)
LIQKDNKELKDVVSFREDMLDFLSKNGVDSNDAFKFAELVRKGNQRKKAKEYDALVIKLREKNVPE